MAIMTNEKFASVSKKRSKKQQMQEPINKKKIVMPSKKADIGIKQKAMETQAKSLFGNNNSMIEPVKKSAGFAKAKSKVKKAKGINLDSMFKK